MKRALKKRQILCRKEEKNLTLFLTAVTSISIFSSSNNREKRETCYGMIMVKFKNSLPLGFSKTFLFFFFYSNNIEVKRHCFRAENGRA
jgi:hypothetical protein